MSERFKKMSKNLGMRSKGVSEEERKNVFLILKEKKQTHKTKTKKSFF